MKSKIRVVVIIFLLYLPTRSQAAEPIPLLDLNDQAHRQVVVDREKGQYLGHPTTVLLEDGKTMLCVYPKGHGRGAIIYKRSNDSGLTRYQRCLRIVWPLETRRLRNAANSLTEA